MLPCIHAHTCIANLARDLHINFTSCYVRLACYVFLLDESELEDADNHRDIEAVMRRRCQCFNGEHLDRNNIVSHSMHAMSNQ